MLCKYNSSTLQHFIDTFPQAFNLYYRFLFSNDFECSLHAYKHCTQAHTHSTLYKETPSTCPQAITWFKSTNVADNTTYIPSLRNF